MYVHKQKSKSFKLGSTLIKKTDDRYLPKATKVASNHDNYLNSSLLNYLPGELKDAETNEPLELSKATWNVREGRLSLNAKTILEMGTGRLDIHKKTNNFICNDEIHSLSRSMLENLTSTINHDNSNYQYSDDILTNKEIEVQGSNDDLALYDNFNKKKHVYQNFNNISNDNKSIDHLDNLSSSKKVANSSNTILKGNHEIIAKFLKEGPLTPMFHTHWNPRGNIIDRNMHINNINRKDDCEVAISFNSSSSDGGNTNNSPSSSSVSSHSNHNTLQSTGAATTTNIITSTSSMIPPSIEFKNKRNWVALEEKEFQELYHIGYQIEKNKSLTKEMGTKGGIREVRTTARKLARLKVNSMKQLVQACLDEEQKDMKRCALEEEHATKPEYLKDLLKVRLEYYT